MLVCISMAEPKSSSNGLLDYRSCGASMVFVFVWDSALVDCPFLHREVALTLHLTLYCRRACNQQCGRQEFRVPVKGGCNNCQQCFPVDRI